MSHCPSCGCEPWTEGEPCMVCGEGIVGTLTIEGPLGRRTFGIHKTDVGQRLLRGVVAECENGSEARFAANPQYRFERSPEGWFVEHIASADENPTFHNGVELPHGEKRPLEPGDAISIGPEKGRVTVV